MLRCPRLQQRVERHHKGLNLPNLFQIIMFRTHEQTYSSGKVFKYNFGSPECVKGVTMMHPKWEVIPTFFIPLFRESTLSDYFHFTESISTLCQVSKTLIGDTSILFFKFSIIWKIFCASVGERVEYNRWSVGWAKSIPFYRQYQRFHVCYLSWEAAEEISVWCFNACLEISDREQGFGLGVEWVSTITELTVNVTTVAGT